MFVRDSNVIEFLNISWISIFAGEWLRKFFDFSCAFWIEPLKKYVAADISNSGKDSLLVTLFPKVMNQLNVKEKKIEFSACRDQFKVVWTIRKYVCVKKLFLILRFVWHLISFSFVIRFLFFECVPYHLCNKNTLSIRFDVLVSHKSFLVHFKCEISKKRKKRRKKACLELYYELKFTDAHMNESWKVKYIVNAIYLSIQTQNTYWECRQWWHVTSFWGLVRVMCTRTT